MSTQTEHRLIQLAREGDLDAFNRIVESYQDAVFSVALRMVRDRALAEDLAQETFLSAWRAIGSYHGNPALDSAVTFRAWLLRIARNATYDHLRRARRRSEVSIDDDGGDGSFADTLPSPQRGPEDFALSAELRRAINDGLATLAVDQRMAVVLVDIEGYSYEEAAATMETNVGTVKSRLNRARGRLRDYLRTRPELLPPGLRQEDKE